MTTPSKRGSQKATKITKPDEWIDVVVKGLASGLTVRQVAQRLEESEFTVAPSTLKAIQAKLDEVRAFAEMSPDDHAAYQLAALRLALEIAINKKDAAAIVNVVRFMAKLTGTEASQRGQKPNGIIHFGFGDIEDGDTQGG